LKTSITPLLCALALLSPLGAHAATIVVDTTADVIADDGSCSLREAITAANQDLAIDTCAAGSGVDEIVLGPGTFTLALAGDDDDNLVGDLDVRSALTVRGAGAAETVIDGACIDRVFDVSGLANLVLQDLSIVNGCALSPASEAVGGDGGAIRAFGSLRIERTILSNNVAGRGGPESKGGAGGAIYGSISPISVIDSVLENNVSGRGGTTGGAYAGPGDGGAIYAAGALVVERSRIEGNQLGVATQGSGPARFTDGSGAAIASAGPLTLRDVAIVGNGKGGMRSAQGTVWAGAKFQVDRVSFVDNRAHEGSALYLAAGGALTNVTAAGNQANQGSFTGGGVPDNDTPRTGGAAIFATSGVTYLSSSTIVGNEGGGVGVIGGNFFIRNSLFAGNVVATLPDRPGDCVRDVALIGTPGPSLFQPAGGCPNNGDVVLTDEPGLGPLQVDEGGIPAYLPLEKTSPAVDSGTCSGFGMIIPEVSADIRRNPRPQGGACDIGAHEFVEPGPVFRTVVEAPGDDCQAGGIRVELGADLNTNLRLDDAEVETSALICNGVDGSDGTDGNDGNDGEDGAPGGSCSVTRSQSGEAVVRCDDGTRITLPAGDTSLLRIVDEPEGETCPAGGRLLQTGVDLDGDGVLAPDEVQQEEAVCNGAEDTEGSACTVEKVSGGGARVSCPDGSIATIAGPKESGGCTASGGAISLFGLLISGWAMRRHSRSG